MDSRHSRNSRSSQGRPQHPLLTKHWPTPELTPKQREILERSKRSHPSQLPPLPSDDEEEDER
jgi:hypothetical protein